MILEDLGINWWSYWNSKTWNKKQGRFLEALLAPLAAFLVQWVISSVVKCISGRRIRRAGRGYMDKNFSSTPSTILRLLINSVMNLHLNVIFSWNNLTRIMRKKSKETHWVSLLIDRNTAVYFDSFGIKNIPLKVLNKIN